MLIKGYEVADNEDLFRCIPPACSGLVIGLIDKYDRERRRWVRIGRVFCDYTVSADREFSTPNVTQCRYLEIDRAKQITVWATLRVIAPAVLGPLCLDPEPY
jgi:hypothetical protein